MLVDMFTFKEWEHEGSGEETVEEYYDGGKLCICGHSYREHHISYFMNGSVLIEECEKFGANEYGGLAADGVTKHCHSFKLKD